VIQEPRNHNSGVSSALGFLSIDLNKSDYVTSIDEYQGMRKKNAVASSEGFL
jgi:hypothetical protein